MDKITIIFNIKGTEFKEEVETQRKLESTKELVTGDKQKKKL